MIDYKELMLLDESNYEIQTYAKCAKTLHDRMCIHSDALSTFTKSSQTNSVLLPLPI